MLVTHPTTAPTACPALWDDCNHSVMASVNGDIYCALCGRPLVIFTWVGEPYKEER